jgi:DNA-binding transcriptional LysR family regulator
MQPEDSDFDLNLLRYLAVLVEECSVSRAADRLGVTQPAVSAALKRLRQRFGDPILVRGSHGMAATAHAADMAHRTAPLLAAAHQLVRSGHGFEPGRTARRFTLMGSDYVQFFVLPRLCARVLAAAPGVSLEHRPANPRKIEPWMESGQVDLGVGYLLTPPPALRCRLLFADQQVCLMRQGHPAAAGPFTVDGYAAQMHVAISPGGAGIYGQRIDAMLQTLGIRRRIGLTLPSFLAMPYVIARTDMVATVPRRLALHFAELLPLTIVEAPLPLPAFELSMFWHERVHHDPANVWLRAEVVAATHGLAS